MAGPHYRLTNAVLSGYKFEGFQWHVEIELQLQSSVQVLLRHSYMSNDLINGPNVPKALLTIFVLLPF